MFHGWGKYEVSDCFVLLIMTFGGWVQSAIAADDRFEPDL